MCSFLAWRVADLYASLLSFSSCRKAPSPGPTASQEEGTGEEGMVAGVLRAGPRVSWKFTLRGSLF